MGGTGIDGASTFNISRATCVEKGYTNQTKAFFGEGNDMPTLVKAAYSGVTWWKKQQSTTAADVSVSVSANKCPDVQPIEGLNLTKWTEKTWYVAQQQLNGYQKPSELFCTLASYNVNTTKKIPFFKGTVLNVHNYENVDEINGKIENTDINIPSGCVHVLKMQADHLNCWWLLVSCPILRQDPIGSLLWVKRIKVNTAGV